MNKGRQIIGELQSFFKHNDASTAIKSITRVMESLTIQSKVIGPVKNPNCKLTFVQVLKLLILFPFFSVKNADHYADSGLMIPAEQVVLSPLCWHYIYVGIIE